MTARFAVSAAEAGMRLDHFLQAKMPEYSRARLQGWIRAGRVRLNGREARASATLKEWDAVEADPAPPAPLHAKAEAIPLDVLYEDDDLVAINKPAGMVVHAGAGVREGTLVNALLARFEKLSALGGELRPGIVHRLDRETSGVLLVAKHDAAHRNLAAQFAGRAVEKRYIALVRGTVKRESGRIEKPIARDPVRRVRMTTRLASGRSALSDYRVLARYEGFTLLEVRIGTGRTHQIRVHLSCIGHPVAGDTLYGAPAAAEGRFFLHSASIRFLLPSTGEPLEVRAPLPPELEKWLERLSVEQ